VEEPANDPVDRDAMLHAAIIACEENAVAEFEQRYRKGFITRGLCRGLTAEDAEDAWQEVFLSTIDRAATLTGPLGLSLRQYASRAMGNQIADHHRGRRSNISLDEVAADPPSERPPVNERIRAAVKRCLERVADNHRVLLEALFVEEVPPDILAETLAVPRNTIYKRKSRAFAEIRPCLEEALGAN
jgi:RNA polymerase sigma factor (sigma-70 family)